jgi:pimeloyl-ACP methyl ester carboxylesterase
MALLRRLDVVDQLVHIDCPTLVCVGEVDPITPVDASHEIVDALRDGIGRLEVIAGAGHFPWMDAPTTYFPLLGEFVAGTTRG